MFVLFGFGTQREVRIRRDIRTCPRCDITTQWARVRLVEQLTMFFMPIARGGRRQPEVCGICGTAVDV